MFLFAEISAKTIWKSTLARIPEAAPEMFRWRMKVERFGKIKISEVFLEERLVKNYYNSNNKKFESVSAFKLNSSISHIKKVSNSFNCV